jgi:hypothetical protein
VAKEEENIFKNYILLSKFSKLASYMPVFNFNAIFRYMFFTNIEPSIIRSPTDINFSPADIQQQFCH